MTRKAEATARRPGTRIAPITSTSTYSQVGAVKASRNGCIKAVRPVGTVCSVASAIHSLPNRWLGRLAECEPRQASRSIQITRDSIALNSAASLLRLRSQQLSQLKNGQTQAEDRCFRAALAHISHKSQVHRGSE